MLLNATEYSQNLRGINQKQVTNNKQPVWPTSGALLMIVWRLLTTTGDFLATSDGICRQLSNVQVR
jgi:hypothetical protein